MELEFLDKLTGMMDGVIMGKVLLAGMGVVGLGKYLKNRAVQKWAELAFHTVEEIARADKKKNSLDKVAEFTKTFRKFMRRAGWWGVVTKGDVDMAKDIAKGDNLLYDHGNAYKEA